LSYVRAAIEQDEEDYTFKVYMSDSAQLAGENKFITRRWCDIANDLKKPPDNRTGDEVAADVIKRLGLSLKGGEEV